ISDRIYLLCFAVRFNESRAVGNNLIHYGEFGRKTGTDDRLGASEFCLWRKKKRFAKLAYLERSM
ncbi:MAG TPA: hypothetical protein PKW59_10240, partial [Thermotogota bacterium]|nr:hypothetical protein [Thermotogota bacterium]